MLEHLGRGLTFVAGSVVGGLALAFLIVAARPELIRGRTAPPPAAAAAPAAQVAPAPSPAAATAPAAAPLPAPASPAGTGLLCRRGAACCTCGGQRVHRPAGHRATVPLARGAVRRVSAALPAAHRAHAGLRGDRR